MQSDSPAIMATMFHLSLTIAAVATGLLFVDPNPMLVLVAMLALVGAYAFYTLKGNEHGTRD